MVVAAYQSQPMDRDIRGFLAFYETNDNARDLSAQAGIQIAGTFISLGIALAAGFLTGLFVRCGITLSNDDLYEDKIFFTIPE